MGPATGEDKAHAIHPAPILTERRRVGQLFQNAAGDYVIGVAVTPRGLQIRSGTPNILGVYLQTLGSEESLPEAEPLAMRRGVWRANVNGSSASKRRTTFTKLTNSYDHCDKHCKEDKRSASGRPFGAAGLHFAVSTIDKMVISR